MPQPKLLHRQRGVALLYVIALVGIIGIMVGISWRMIKNGNTLATLNQADAQTRLLALAGMDYALAKIGPPGPFQDLNYSTEHLEYQFEGPDHKFDLSVRSYGLFARSVSTGKTSLPRPGRSSPYSGLLGQWLDLSQLPALGLLNHEGNMVLAGTAQVTGAVMLWRGDVRKATDYNVRWTGYGGHAGPVFDSTANAWKMCKMNFSRADSWIKRQVEMLASKDFSKDTDFDSASIQDLLLPDSGLVQGNLKNTRIISSQFIRVGSSADLFHCKLISTRIVIEGDALIEKSLVFASQTIDIKGAKIIGGQFLAGDSVRINSKQTLKSFPIFYAQGHIQNRGKPDSTMVGALMVEMANGEGIFISACQEHPLYDQDVRLSISNESILTGLVYTPCHAKMEGSLQGSLICFNLKFEYKGTIWLGHLKDAHIKGIAGRKVIPAPLLFPGFSPAAFTNGTL